MLFLTAYETNLAKIPIILSVPEIVAYHVPPKPPRILAFLRNRQCLACVRPIQDARG